MGGKSHIYFSEILTHPPPSEKLALLENFFPRLETILSVTRNLDRNWSITDLLIEIV